MDNQHREIKGYRELSQAEIDAMNLIKEAAEQIEKLLNCLPESVDQRWLSIGRTNLQQGFMAVTRSIAKPESF